MGESSLLPNVSAAISVEFGAWTIAADRNFEWDKLLVRTVDSKSTRTHPNCVVSSCFNGFPT